MVDTVLSGGWIIDGTRTPPYQADLCTVSYTHLDVYKRQALLRHKHQVLHPDPELTREVHSWLNGEDHSRLGYQLCDCTYIPLLMLCLANKMPQAVGEVLTIARRSAMFPGRDVPLPDGHNILAAQQHQMCIRDRGISASGGGIGGLWRRCWAG